MWWQEEIIWIWTNNAQNGQRSYLCSNINFSCVTNWLNLSRAWLPDAPLISMAGECSSSSWRCNLSGLGVASTWLCSKWPISWTWLWQWGCISKRTPACPVHVTVAVPCQTCIRGWVTSCVAVVRKLWYPASAPFTAKPFIYRSLAHGGRYRKGQASREVCELTTTGCSVNVATAIFVSLCSVLLVSCRDRWRRTQYAHTPLTLC